MSKILPKKLDRITHGLDVVAEECEKVGAFDIMSKIDRANYYLRGPVIVGELSVESIYNEQRNILKSQLGLIQNSKRQEYLTSLLHEAVGVARFDQRILERVTDQVGTDYAIELCAKVKAAHKVISYFFEDK